MKPKQIFLCTVLTGVVWMNGLAGLHSADLAAPSLGANTEAARVLAPGDLGLGRLMPDLAFKPMQGRKFKVSDDKKARALVIAFTSASCPITKRYGATLAALERQYGARGVRFIWVNPMPSDSKSDITQMIQAHGFSGPYCRETPKNAAAALGARSTAEVFVLDAARTLVYRGAVDDQYGLGYSLEAPREKYLVQALDSLLAGTTPLVQVTTAPGCALETAAVKPLASTPLTYHARISRLVQRHCLDCHHAGGVGPFSLETFADLDSHAGMIAKVIEKGNMPPWFAAPTHGGASPWINDRTLPDPDKADLLAWLKGGRKKGHAADAPLPRAYATEWGIGLPDVIVQIPEAFEVQATGFMKYKNVLVETDYKEDKWVQSLEVLPTAREVVHHVLVHVVPADQIEKVRKKGGGAQGDNFFAAYVPGSNQLKYPDGFAKRIPAGAALHFQIHYTPRGTATRDQTRLGLIFAKTAPQHEVRVAAVAAKLRIPPGEPNHKVNGTLPIVFDARLLAFMPHMHMRGKAYRYELELPNQEKQLVLEVPRYDFNWQLQYRLTQPLEAPAGSRLLGTAWYDNSTNNPANPDPTREVTWGEQTDEEMMLGYVEYYIPSLKPGGPALSMAEIALRDGGAVFRKLDKNRDDKITAEESPTQEAFREADSDQDQAVSREEFKVYWQRRQQKAAAR